MSDVTAREEVIVLVNALHLPLLGERQAPRCLPRRVVRGQQIHDIVA
jgi:hypothetical protein